MLREKPEGIPPRQRRQIIVVDEVEEWEHHIGALGRGSVDPDPVGSGCGCFSGCFSIALIIIVVVVLLALIL